MQVCNSFKLRLARVQSVVKNVVNRRLRKEKKRRSIQISEPFGFRHVATNIKGLSDEEYVPDLTCISSCQASPPGLPKSSPRQPPIARRKLQVLREKAIASRFATIDEQQHDPHQKPSRPNKTRTGYRGLTSTPLSASRPSITQSFAAEDSGSHLTHTTASSVSGASDLGSDGKETLI